MAKVKSASLTLFVWATSTPRHGTPRLLLSSLLPLRLISGGPTWREGVHLFHRCDLLSSRPTAISAPKIIALTSNCRGPQAVIFPSSGDEPYPVKSLRSADISVEDPRSDKQLNLT
ncbi:hypothetical protein IGI04_006761 [Brassica rapa subsp. trilocularis]|uniref:Uncharacterized protein n=1 Tax=Brassica rapa subsp. trilocularis TaxID=1813537 RepID=A0ABQ7NHS8_BRACM|nr:hypothetical protein IGI04_006761 [Brassica rapa subsp. trilocularis]